MKTARTVQFLSVAIIAILAVAGCKKNEEATAANAPPAAPAPAPAAPEAVAPAPAAVSVSSVTVGTTAAADKSVAAASSFKPSDKIIVSVKTEGAASNTALDAKLTYKDGQTAGQQSATLNTTGADTTNVEFANSQPWPAGKYKVDVTLNGQPAGLTQEIEVK